MNISNIVGTGSGGVLTFDITLVDQDTGQAPTWLSLSHSDGFVNPGETLPAQVTFDATDLPEGVHNAQVTIANNDADENPVTVSAVLTVENPEIEVSHAFFSVVQDRDLVTTADLTITNTGDGTLVFDITVDPRRLAAGLGGSSGPLGAGGPDQFGYSWTDSDEPGGPVFNWIDISASGTQIGEGDDRQFTIPIGFDFEFYGTVYDTAYVGTNGILGFSSSEMSDLSNQLLPDPNAPNNLVSAFWDDLRVQTSNRLLREVVGQAPNRKLVVEWFGVTEFGNSEASHTFEVILEERTGNILVQYLSMNGDLDSATVGIENATGDDGLTANFNAAYVHDELSVLFSTGQLFDFASVEPAAGTVAPGESVDVTVTFDSSELDPGVYTADIVINNNDPDEDPTVVTGSLTVPPPDIDVSPLVIDVGILDRGCSTADLTITNTGDGTLIFEIPGVDGTITAAPAAGSVAPGGSLNVVLTVCAAELLPGVHQLDLVILSNDPDEGEVIVAVSFIVPPPDIGVAPDSFTLTQDRDQVTTADLTITNTGDGTLVFDITVQQPEQAAAVVVKDEELLPVGPTTDEAPPSAVGSVPVQPLQGAEFLVIDHGRDKRALAGHTVDTISEATFATFPLAQMVEYDVIYFEPSWSSYDNLRANMAALREYVEQGGVAVINIAGNIGSATDIDPLGTDYDQSQAHDAETIQLPEHDYITGAPFGGTPLTAADFSGWRFTDHGWLTGFPGSSEVVLRNTDGASWLQYRLGRGEVIVTSLTYGWGCCGGKGTPLSNLVEYSLFLPAVTFMSVEPDVGSVAPGQSVTLTVTFDSTDLDPGSHIAQIVIASNDPDENPTIVTGSLMVLPPDIGVSPASFTVTQDRDEVTTADLTITNTGDGTLVFDIETPFPPAGGPFMSVDPDIGYLAPGQSVTLTVTFDSTDLDPGSHLAQIVIASNDPDENPTIVTGSLTVLPPDIEVTPQAIELGILDRDACSAADLTISNTGDGTLVFEITGRGSGDLTAVPTTGDVSPGRNVVIALTVCATDLDPGAHQAEAVISSNDQNDAQVVVVISFAVPPPDIGVSPASFDVTQDRDRVTTADLTITNAGDGTLVFDIETLFLPVGVPWLSVAPDHGTAAPGQSLDLVVTFDTAGLAPGVHTADMVITNNDPDEDPTIIAVTLTLPPPDIQVSPSFVAVVLGVDQVTTVDLTVPNLGEGTLVFDLAVESVEEVPASATANRPHRAGGPDLFGYSWIDSDEPGGPAFDWIDISATGRSIGAGDDSQFTISIGFGFEFYGTVYDTVYVGTNGILGFSSSGMSSLGNQLLPDPSTPNNLVSAFWDDLRVHTSNRLLYEVVGQAPNRKLVVEWFGVTEFGNSGASHTFEVILEETTGNVLVQYLSMNGDLDSATVGIENATGDDGLTANFNALYVQNELAVLFSTFQPFTSVEPVGGVVLPGGSLNVTLTLDSTGLERGIHRENVVISSNDPDENPTIVPVTLGVGLAQIEGRVTLGGQTDHSGTIIAFVGPDVQTAVTDESGNFSVFLALGTYTVRAAHPYHLSAQTVVEVQLGDVLSLTTELLGGDVNNDGVINARDLALAGKNINKNESLWR